MRVKRGKTTRKKHKKILKATKGMKGLRTTSVKKANEALLKSLSYSYRDRRTKKRDFRKLWIQRISALAKNNGMNYSTLMNKLNKNKIELDRKVLSELAINEPETMKEIINKVK